MHCSLRRNFGNEMGAPMVLHPECLLSSISRPLDYVMLGVRAKQVRIHIVEVLSFWIFTSYVYILPWET